MCSPLLSPPSPSPLYPSCSLRSRSSSNFWSTLSSLSSLSSSLSFAPAFFISLFPRSVALSHFGNPDSITSPFCFFQIFLIHIYTLFLFHSIEIFIIESRRDISSDMLVQRRFATLLSYRRFRGTQLYLICVPRDSARSIEPLTLMDSSGHFIHCRFIRGILNR